MFFWTEELCRILFLPICTSRIYSVNVYIFSKINQPLTPNYPNYSSHLSPPVILVIPVSPVILVSLVALVMLVIHASYSPVSALCCKKKYRKETNRVKKQTILFKFYLLF